MRPISVMIAEDDEAFAGALAELLSSHGGFRIVGRAVDAEAAVSLARRERPRVALVDVRMPSGGGVAAARQLTRLDPPPRVIALSASRDREAVIAMLRAGAIGYVVKGEPADEIFAAIHRAVRGDSTLSAPVASEVIGVAVERLSREGEEALTRTALIERLRWEMEEGLEMAFQPIFELERNAVVGYEALTRFANGRAGGPAERFAEAHEVGLGAELELAAIDAALSAATEAAADGGMIDGGFIALNASPAVVCSEEMAELLARERWPATVIEVTEHAAVHDYTAFRSATDRLRRYGVRLAVDDLGAGYASLRHVLQMAPDMIKLDLSLTHAIDAERPRRALAKALIAFAAETETAVVAEGIETEPERETLLAIGVKYGQGYHLGMPGPLPGGPEAMAQVSAGVD